jgi:UDP-3-O-[3-hydroxymyristoyl] N-acetylglucosamine deacetylase
MTTPGQTRRQATLGAPFERGGRGLHTGRWTAARITPAPEGHGIVFRRHLPGGGSIDIPALWSFHHSQPACTALRRNGILVRTVEHLLASLYALQIDNVLAEIDGEELPIFDGSAVPWCEGIALAGRVEQDAPVTVLRIRREITVTDRHRRLSIAPGPGFTVSAHIALEHLGSFDWHGPVGPANFPCEIAPSRSFGRLFRVMAGRAYGFMTRTPLLQGCDPRSAALLIGSRVVGGLRMPDELVRHRVLDVIGDLALAGYPIEGHVAAAHACHALNHILVATLMSDRTAWELA